MRNSSLAAIGAIDLGTTATVALSLVLALQPGKCATDVMRVQTGTDPV